MTCNASVVAQQEQSRTSFSARAHAHGDDGRLTSRGLPSLCLAHPLRRSRVEAKGAGRRRPVPARGGEGMVYEALLSQ